MSLVLAVGRVRRPEFSSRLAPSCTLQAVEVLCGPARSRGHRGRMQSLISSLLGAMSGLLAKQPLMGGRGLWEASQEGGQHCLSCAPAGRVRVPAGLLAPTQ